jgi:DNA polymerase-3 subunit delta
LSCYLVSGDEPLLVQEALDAVRAKARQQGFSARELFVQTAGFDWGELASAGGNLSLFAERRIIELRLPTGKPGVKGSAAIAGFAANEDPDILFLASAPRLDRSAANAKWVKAIEANGGLVQVWPVGNRDLPGWIDARMKSAGLLPDRDAVRLVADRVEGNLLAAQQEIEKLRLLLGEGPVSATDVDTAVADSSRFDVYKLVDAAVGGNAARAVRILGGLRTEGIEPVIVMWALTRELRSLAGLVDSIRGGTDLSTAMRQARVWQNRQGLVRSCIGRHQPGDFYRLLKMARDADAAAKGQKRADPWQLAMRIVLELASAGKKAA